MIQKGIFMTPGKNGKMQTAETADSCRRNSMESNTAGHVAFHKESCLLSPMQKRALEFDAFTLEHDHAFDKLCNIVTSPSVNDFDEFIMEHSAAIISLCDGDYALKRLKKKSKITSTAAASSGELVDTDDE